MILSEEGIQEAANRIAEALHPKKIILFGSYARGQATEESDLDLMVIGPRHLKEYDAMIAGRQAVGNVGVGGGCASLQRRGGGRKVGMVDNTRLLGAPGRKSAV